MSSRAARATQKNLVPGVEGGEIERLRGGRNSGKLREELFLFLILTVFWVTWASPLLARRMRLQLGSVDKQESTI